MIEISIKVSNEEQSYVKKYLCYDEDIVMNRNCQKLSDMVHETIKEFSGQPDRDPVIRVRMDW